MLWGLSLAQAGSVSLWLTELSESGLKSGSVLVQTGAPVAGGTDCSTARAAEPELSRDTFS